MSLLVDDRDVRFVLFDQLRIGELTKKAAFQEHSEEVFQMVLTEAERLAEKVLAPANADGDKGARFEEGQVKVPKSFHACYQAACEGGWICPTDDMEVGGQGLPTSLATAAYEFLYGANPSFVASLTLNHGAGLLVEKYGTEEQKALFLEKLFTGEWAGTMCLTEPGAGSDLGVLKTKAIRTPAGTFQIQGTKQFITYGDHDLTENIIHPVLARIEGDPEGSKGISIFLVPKISVNPDGSLGVPNDVACTGIEHKMGLNGSPTCSLYFGENGDCVGTLLGKERQGLATMFLMMNEERLFVAVNSQGLASTAYLHALKFARERVQGTKGIQAIDLLGRKILRDKGQSLAWLLEETKPVLERTRNHPALSAYVPEVEKGFKSLQEAAEHLSSLVDQGEVAAGFLEATPLLEIFGDVLLGWLHLWQAEVAHGKLEQIYNEADAQSAEDREALIHTNPEAAFLKGKITTARFYMGRLLPEVSGKVEALKRKEFAPLEIPDESF